MRNGKAMEWNGNGNDLQTRSVFAASDRYQRASTRLDLVGASETKMDHSICTL